MDRPSPVRFPYMVWAHTDFARTRHPLSGSGMPQADARLFRELSALDLGHPCAEALPALERAIAERYGVSPERVLVAVGATGGMHLAAQTWFRPGVRVLTDTPSYEPFRALPELFGAELVLHDRRLEAGWRLDPAAVRRTLGARRGPAHLFVANPHNPTGAESTREELVDLARV